MSIYKINETRVKQKMKVKSGLRTSLLQIILIPLILLTICIIAYSSYYLTILVYDEVESELKGVAQSVRTLYETTFSGECRIENGKVIYQGENDIADIGQAVEGYKRAFEVDVTIFYQDRRMVTTIQNEQGEPIVNTKANADVVKDVLEDRREKFYSHTDINNNRYVSYYCPLVDAEGNCTGMVFAGKQVQHVKDIVMRGLIPMVCAIFVSMVVVILIMSIYAGRLTRCLRQLGDFFVKVEGGDLKTALGCQIVERKDELGQIGKSAIQMQMSLRDLIERDSLTGLYNRHYGEVFLREARERMIADGTPFYVGIGDIDFFKKFNDEHGHDCGDLVLREISAILRCCVQDQGIVSRWGGEEFLFVLWGGGIKDINRFFNEVADKVRSKSLEYDGQRLRVTMTFGVADGDSRLHTDDIVKMADEALYEGKETGRNKVVYKQL